VAYREDAPSWRALTAAAATCPPAAYVACIIERITPGQFQEPVGVDDWRVLFSRACASFRTGSFATSVPLVDAIGSLAVPFWRAVLGYQELGDKDLIDPRGSGPPFWFQAMDAKRPQRNRIHIEMIR